MTAVPQRNELICLICNHTVFTVHRDQYRCCKCGGSTGERVTTSASLYQLENAFEPPTHRQSRG
jgi:hypothetical protein